MGKLFFFLPIKTQTKCEKVKESIVNEKCPYYRLIHAFSVYYSSIISLFFDYKILFQGFRNIVHLI